MTEQRISMSKPDYVTQLEAHFGVPSQTAFGSAVFSTNVQPDQDLEQVALATYRHFVGDLWDRYGKAAWLTPWQVVYTRPASAAPDITAELATLPDPAARLSASLLLEDLPDPDAAHTALTAAFDDAAVRELVVYRLGDGAAMSGILIAARRSQSDEAILLILLLD
jgi:hypothetical protein